MKQRTHCRRGHRYTVKSTIVRTDKQTGRTYRHCRICQAERHNMGNHARKLGYASVAELRKLLLCDAVNPIRIHPPRRSPHGTTGR
jgi:hypothetical protein